MRQVLAIVGGAVVAGLGAVVLGEYDLRGSTAIIGFPLYGLAVTEVALAVGKRIATGTLAAIGVVVAAGLSWAMWISFGHFRNDVTPPALSWVMVLLAVVAAVAWGRSGRNRHSPGAEARATAADPAGPAQSPVVDDEVLP